MANLSEITREHLGGSATWEDLDQFKAWVRELLHTKDLSEEEAIALLWGAGDYLAAAKRLGLWEGSIYDPA